MQTDNAILVLCNHKATRRHLQSYNVYKEKCLFMYVYAVCLKPVLTSYNSPEICCISTD